MSKEEQAGDILGIRATKPPIGDFAGYKDRLTGCTSRDDEPGRCRSQSIEPRRSVPNNNDGSLMET